MLSYDCSNGHSKFAIKVTFWYNLGNFIVKKGSELWIFLTNCVNQLC